MHVHAVGNCNDPNLDPFGNISTSCGVCVRLVEVEVHLKVGQFARHPGTHCLTCGAPVHKLRDIVREVMAL